MRAPPALLLAAALLVPGPSALARAQEPRPAASGLAAEQVEQDQRRLTEAGCYAGPVDGLNGPDLERARRACPDQSPHLVIETGMHTAAIGSMAVDARCERAVTGSSDKSVRVWSLPDGRLQRTIRPPMGPGDRGKVHAVALSPDGRWAAAGGADAHAEVDGTGAVTLFALDSGADRRLGALPSDVGALAFSRDGRRLAVGLLDGGLRIFDVGAGTEVLSDVDYQGEINSLAYADTGSVYAVSSDGWLHVYDDRLRHRRVRTPGRKPFSIALSPDGTRLAVGYDSTTRVDRFAAPSMAFLGSVDPVGGTGTDDDADLAVTAWTRDGLLHAGGAFHIRAQGGERHVVQAWRGDGTRVGPPRAVSTDTVQALARCGGGLAFATTDPSFGMIDAKGVVRVLGRTVAADMRGKIGPDFGISADARQVYFGLEQNGASPVLFDLSKATLHPVSTMPDGLARANVRGLDVSRWEDSAMTAVDGRRLALDRFESARSLAITRDAKKFFLGTDFSLRAYDDKGDELGEGKNAPEAVFGLNLTPDDRILVAAVGDGTIRWYRARDRAELLTLFVNRSDMRWVAWTPSGYYMASAGGEDLIGWQINRGWSQEAEFFPASQFRERYNRPDVVQLTLDALDEGVAVARADGERARASAPAKVEGAAAPAAPPTLGAASPFAAPLPPLARIVSPANGGRFTVPLVDIEYAVHPSPGQPIDLVQALVDGRVVAAQRSTISGDAQGTFTLSLPPQDATVEVRASSGPLSGPGARVKLTYDGEPRPPSTKPDLYLLAVGVDDYVNSAEFPKTYARRDVEDFAAALRKQEGKLYGRVVVRQLTDDRATLADLRAVFDEFGQAGDRDNVIVYVAGHGFVGLNDQKFRFMLRTADLGRLNSSSLTARDLIEPLSALRGRKMLLIESCHAGTALPATANASSYDMGTAMNSLRREASSDLVIVGAAAGLELARFDARWDDHGAFTQALIEAMADGKASVGEGRITALSLFHYVHDCVVALTGQSQHPEMTPPEKDLSDFTVGLAR